jgi:hypothetical protein
VSLEQLAKIVLWVGVGILVVGGLLYLAARLGLTKLPGTFVYRGENLTVYVPIGLMVLVSIVGSLVLHFLSRR